MASSDSLQFGQRLRQLRQAAGLTQEELAERAGISVKAVSALETGRRQRPYPHTVRALAEALGLPEEERAGFAGLRPERRQAPSASDLAQHLLPVAPAALIGRETELAEVVDLLRSETARLVTLTGAGGVGKTRLALEVAALLGGAEAVQVVFVPLAALEDPALVLPTVAQTLGIPESGDRSLLDVLISSLGTHSWLIVLDNIEHVLEVAPELAALLAACPGVTVLATGRAPLKIRAEYEYPVRPLPLPEQREVQVLDEVVSVSSVQLFMERAQAAVPGFGLTQANCTAVAAICRRLDGIPLALELVAARMRFLSPVELLARLDHVLPLLVGGSRDLPQRQQTMQAAINWSYELLGPVERVLFRRLSIFSGGWTLEAAETVVAWDEIPVDGVIESLAGLVEQSLVVVERSPDGTTRYRMLEMIRQFAAGRVAERGESSTLFDRHLDWCLALAQQAAAELRGPSQQAWLDRLEQEHDNLRAALKWSQQGDSKMTLHLQLATALWRFWETRGHLTEGRRWLEDALTVGGDVPDDLKAEACNAAGNLARDQGDHTRAVELYEASLTLRRNLGDTYGMAQSLNNLGNMMLDQGQYEQATRLYAEALAFFRELGKEWDIANALNNMGIALGHRGEYARATGLLEEALLLRERLGEKVSRARSLDALGVVMRKQGDLERAGTLHEESLTLRRELGETRGIAIALNNLGVVARYQGDHAEAARLIEESLELRRKVGDLFGIAASLTALAEVVHQQGNVARAVGLFEEAIVLQQQVGNNEGVAGCLLGLAATVADAGWAAHLLGASDNLRETMQLPVPPVDVASYERTVAAIRSGLTASEFSAAHSAGRAMTLQQAIACALGRISPES